MSAESNAEKLGVRMGDIILSVNGEHIATAVEVYVHYRSNHIPYVIINRSHTCIIFCFMLIYVTCCYFSWRISC